MDGWMWGWMDEGWMDENMEGCWMDGWMKAWTDVKDKEGKSPRE